MAILACKTTTLSVGKSTKQIHYPGVKSGTTFIKYKVAFKNETAFIIERVLLNDQIVDNCELYSVQLKKYVNVNESHSNGDYILTFKIKNIQRIDAKDLVALLVKGNSITEKINVHIKKTKPLRRR